MEVGSKYYVPDERLNPRVVEWTKRIYDKFTTNDADALVVAQLLGHGSLSGAFNTKMGVVGAYGVAERRLGKIRVTDIGRKIVFSNDPKEKLEGVKSALFKVPLWERLYGEYTKKGAELPSNFWADLARIADIPPDDAKTKADWVAKAYNDDISFLKSIEKELGSTPPAMVQKDEGSGQAVRLPSLTTQMGLPSISNATSGQILFTSLDDKIQLSVPRSARHIEMLRTFVENALKVIEEELVAEAKLVTKQDRASKDSD